MDQRSRWRANESKRWSVRWASGRPFVYFLWRSHCGDFGNLRLLSTRPAATFVQSSPLARSGHRCGLTIQSTGEPMAGRATPTLYFRFRAVVRCLPVTSNVRRRREHPPHPTSAELDQPQFNTMRSCIPAPAQRRQVGGEATRTALRPCADWLVSIDRPPQGGGEQHLWQFTTRKQQPIHRRAVSQEPCGSASAIICTGSCAAARRNASSRRAGPPLPLAALTLGATTPNPSVELRANGMPPGPRYSAGVHYL